MMEFKKGHYYKYDGSKRKGWCIIFLVLDINYPANQIIARVVWDNKADGLDWTGRQIPFKLSELNFTKDTDYIVEVKESDIIFELI